MCFIVKNVCKPSPLWLLSCPGTQCVEGWVDESVILSSPRCWIVTAGCLGFPCRYGACPHRQVFLFEPTKQLCCNTFQVDNIPNEFWTRAEQLCWNEGRSPFHLFPNVSENSAPFQVRRKVGFCGEKVFSLDHFHCKGNFTSRICTSWTPQRTDWNLSKKYEQTAKNRLKLVEKIWTDHKEILQVWLDMETFWWTRWRFAILPRHFQLTLSLLRTHNSSVDLRITPVQYLRAVPEQYGRTGNDCYKFAIDSSTTGEVFPTTQDKHVLCATLVLNVKRAFSLLSKVPNLSWILGFSYTQNFPGSVVGAVIIEGFYVVFDREHRQLGFAQTTCHQRSDQFVPTVGEPYPTYSE